MAINAEQLNIILSARDKEFTKAMERSQRRVEMFAKKSQSNLSKSAKSFDLLGTAAKRIGPILAAAFSARAVTNLTKAASEIGKLADMSGTSVVEFQKFAVGAKTVGIEMAKAADIIKDVNDKVGDFISTGAGPMADFFENIAPAVGVTADQFAKLSGPQALLLYVKSLEKANLSQSEMTFYMEAIASDATSLLPLLRNNGQQMRFLGDEAQRTGRILDSDAVDGARELEKEMSDLASTISTQLSTAILDHKDELLSVVQFITQTAIPAFSSLIGTISDAKGLYDAFRGTAATDGEGARQDPAVTQAELDAERGLGGGDTSSTGLFYVDDNGDVQEYGTAGAAKPIAGITAPAKRPSVVRAGIDPDKPSQSGAGSSSKAVDAVADLKEKYRSLIGVLDEAVGLNNEYEDTQTMLNNALQSGAITQDEFNIGMGLAKQRLEDAAFEASELSSIMQTVEGSMESAFMSMIDGTASASDAFKSMASSIIKELYRVLVVQKIVGAISGAITGGGGLSSGVSPIPTPRPAASGRSVSAGDAYMTGEHGRELFVPKVDGRVISAAQTNNMQRGGGDGGVTVIQNNTFGNGVNRAEINAMLPKMVEASKAAVLDAKRQGGSYGKAFG